MGDEHKVASAPTPPPSLLRTVRAVAWSFIGLRQRSEFENDIKQLNPLHLVAVGLGAGVLLVLALVAVVHWVV